ncbi:DUF4181 domain-containing protein [Bacillus haikouensis]|nr:DUF4181 domain-containing protein [Bacillus haikouensis]
MGLFFLKTILFLLIYFLLLYAAHLGISGWLGIERRKIWSRDNIINEHHEKVDRIHKWILMIVLFSCPVIDVLYDFEQWYQNPYTYILVILLSGSLLKAYMEWKYVEDKREYTYTIFETSFNIVLLILFFTVGVQYLNNSF